jgi:CheY-like chemotaxis protein
MGDKGILEVSLFRVDLSKSELAAQSIVDLKPGPYLKLCISDTGSGMDTATLERIFDPYFTTKEVGKGSGLGLAVVHGIVKRHDGAITVQSEPGKGSTFSIYIPAVEAGAGVVIETGQALPTGTERIFLIDDEPILVEMGTAILERLGYEVTPETDSLRALEIFRSMPGEFDLIITDYTMPNMTGADLSREIRQIQPDIPIILCTGFSEKVNEESAVDLGVGLVMKPFSMKQIAELVRKVLRARES